MADPIELSPTFQTEALGSGDVRVTLRWYSKDDLDLHVIDPDGNEIYYLNDRVSNGGELDVDSNPACENMTFTPVENIFWPTGESPSGSYSVRVVYYKSCVSAGPVEYEVTVLVEGQTNSFSGRVDYENDELFVIDFTR